MTKLIVISAPSGAGKTTLCHKILKEFSNITLSVSSTTRNPRGHEKDGVDYFFISKNEFKNLIKKNRFAEWALVHENYYGTSKDVIDQALKKNQSVLLDIDVQGAASLRKDYPNICHTFFIAPPSLKELETRLRQRGTDSEETIQKRIQNAKSEMEKSKFFDHIIINDSLDRAYEELSKHIRKALTEARNG